LGTVEVVGALITQVKLYVPGRVGRIGVVSDDRGLEGTRDCGRTGDGVHPGYPHSGGHDIDSGVGQDGVEQGRVPVVTVADHVFHLLAVRATQPAVGCAVAPRIRMRRPACPMTAST
jgi:hypothetical protein